MTRHVTLDVTTGFKFFYIFFYVLGGTFYSLLSDLPAIIWFGLTQRRTFKFKIPK